MPEEHNRVLTDHAADLLLAPTQVAMEHLAREGLAERSVLVGDVMTDVCYSVRDAVRQLPHPLGELADEPYVVATIHRPDNTDDPDRLAAIVTALRSLPTRCVVLVHPRAGRPRAGVSALSSPAAAWLPGPRWPIPRWSPRCSVRRAW